ncbi:MAG: hypothetical protein WCG48_00990 [Candidatus Berkelbacteria bacterium]
MKLNTILKSKKKAFGIIEVLIGSMIIVAVLVAIVGIGKMSLNAAEGNRQRIKATFLAQDALEKVRLMRDTNWIDGSAATEWDSVPNDTNNKMTDLLKPASTILYYNFEADKLTKKTDNTFFEKINTADQPQFNYLRQVKIDKVGSLLPEMDSNITESDKIKNANAFLATVTVKWGKDNQIEIKEILTNWRTNY